MKKIPFAVLIGLLLLLGACSSTNNEGQAEIEEPTEQGVGFSLAGDSIEEAEKIPAEEKEQIIAAFDEYIKAFNDKDIDAYIDVLSQEAESFNLEEERIYMEETFEAYDLKRTASDVTIVKYSESEAQVFSKLKTSMKQLETGLETNPTGRQVTLFTNNGTAWKVSSVHYIGDNAQK